MSDVQTFTDVAAQGDRSVGGKAFALARLATAGFRVPSFIILRSPNLSDADWTHLNEWWDSIGRSPLAVRSSADGEDSGEFSFAGQLQSFLNVRDEASLRTAVQSCFSSLFRPASVSYQERMGIQARGMNVLVQQMVEPAYSGVFFSYDPRGHREGWFLEFVAGLGEDLVSGRVTPVRVHEKAEWPTLPPGMSKDSLEQVIQAGQKVGAFFGYPIDMEWAIDAKGGAWVLQARPITTGGAESEDVTALMRAELAQLKREQSPDTIWDGQTFAEWTGVPTEMTFRLWQRAFAPEGAFGKVLKDVGYEGFSSGSAEPSLLERVMGRAFINLRRLEDLYFHHIPYALETKPAPHLEFHWEKVDWPTLVRTPYSLFKMSQVAWRLRHQRSTWIQAAERALSQQSDGATFPQVAALADISPEMFRDWSLEKLRASFVAETTRFAQERLYWSFLLITLAESSLHSLRVLLTADIGREEADHLLQRWMASDLKTVTLEMDQAYRAACVEPQHRASFLARYGFRGPGEMDLSAPRWSEMKEKAFIEVKPRAQDAGRESSLAKSSLDRDLEERIRFIRRPAVKQEWETLKTCLELRERWKMDLMRDYTRLRWMALEIGRREGWGENVFWLTPEEVTSSLDLEKAKAIAAGRRQKISLFQHIHLPSLLSLGDLEAILSGEKASERKDAVVHGEGLSPGMTFGTVRVVEDPHEAETGDWPENAILVAQATDPGWTPLFQRAKGIVVERGGVLSHCAILAREMGLPAVSGFVGCTTRLKNGDRIWVDGDHGHVRIN